LAQVLPSSRRCGKPSSYQQAFSIRMALCPPDLFSIFLIIVGWVSMSVLSSALGAALVKVAGINAESEHVDSAVQLPYFNYTLAGVDQQTRISTTACDTAELIIWILLAFMYRHRVSNHRPAVALPPISASEAAVPKAHALYFFSGFATYIRMGDTFEAAGVTSFWAPFLTFAFSRIAAFIIGALPGMVAGIPSLSTLLALGLLYAKWRRELCGKLKDHEANSGSFCRDWMCYSFCCCFMAAEEAHAVDMAFGVNVDCYLNLQAVGEPVRLTP